MSNKNNYSQNKIAAYSILSTIIYQGIGFFSAPLFSRILGSKNYGIVSIFLTWVSIITIFVGLESSASLGSARYKFTQDEQKQYRSSVVFLCVLSLTVLVGISFVLIKPLELLIGLDKSLIFLMFVYAFFSFCVNFQQSIWTFEFKAREKLFLSVMIMVASFILSYTIIIRLPDSLNYWGRIIGDGISHIIPGMLIFFIIIAKGRVLYNRTYWIFCLNVSLPLVFHSLSNLLLNQTDKIMLQKLTDLSSVGMYSFVVTFSSIMLTLYSSLNNSWIPFYYRYADQKKIEEIKVHTKYYLELFTVLSVGFVLLSREVFQVFASDDYYPAMSCIPVLVSGIYWVFLYSFSINYELFKGNTKLIPIATIFAALLNMLLNYLWIKNNGFVGAALATSLSHFLQFVFHYVVAKIIVKGNEFPFTLKMYFPYVLIFGLSALAFFLFADYRIMRWIVGMIIGIWELLRIIKRKNIF